MPFGGWKLQSKTQDNTNYNQSLALFRKDKGADRAARGFFESQSQGRTAAGRGTNKTADCQVLCWRGEKTGGQVQGDQSGSWSITCRITTQDSTWEIKWGELEFQYLTNFIHFYYDQPICFACRIKFKTTQRSHLFLINFLPLEMEVK